VKLKGPGSPRISPISQTRDREFESVPLHRRVICEPDFLEIVAGTEYLPELGRLALWHGTQPIEFEAL
jgi:hypothetical protein